MKISNEFFNIINRKFSNWLKPWMGSQSFKLLLPLSLYSIPFPSYNLTTSNNVPLLTRINNLVEKLETIIHSPHQIDDDWKWNVSFVYSWVVNQKLYLRPFSFSITCVPLRMVDSHMLVTLLTNYIHSIRLCCVCALHNLYLSNHSPQHTLRFILFFISALPH